MVNPNDRYSMYAGYSFLHGTETMQYLKRVSDGQRLHWAYLMLAFNPNIFFHHLERQKIISYFCAQINLASDEEFC